MSVCGGCAVLCCGVVWLGTERAVLGRRRCAARPYVYTSHSGRLDLCLHVSSMHTFCLQPPTLVMCSTASNAFTMMRGEEMKIPIFVCMSVCRFDVLLGGGGVGQEMVFEEWKEQV